jgi:hypothetical protein
VTPLPCQTCGHIDWAHEDVLTGVHHTANLIGWCYECAAPCDLFILEEEAS